VQQRPEASNAPAAGASISSGQAAWKAHLTDDEIREILADAQDIESREICDCPQPTEGYEFEK
jgi:hypothetical protein